MVPSENGAFRNECGKITTVVRSANQEAPGSLTASL